MFDDSPDPLAHAIGAAHAHAARALRDAERLRGELVALTEGLAATRAHLAAVGRAA